MDINTALTFVIKWIKHWTKAVGIYDEDQLKEINEAIFVIERTVVMISEFRELHKDY